MSLSETAARVIDLANAIRDYWDAELPKRHPTYPIIKSGADDGPPPKEEKELRDLLESLPVTELYRLMALMYLGRGDFNPLGLGPVSRDLAQQFPQREGAIRQMMAKGPLGAYLADGLRELAAAGIDLDHPEPSAA